VLLVRVFAATFELLENEEEREQVTRDVRYVHD